MDVLYSCRQWLRVIWSLHGVSPLIALTLFGADPFRWAHEICADDNEERAIVIASMNEMAYVLQAWLPLIVWQQIDAPQYQKGFITVSVLSILLMITAFVLKLLHRRQNSR